MHNFNIILDKFLKGETGSLKRDSNSVYVATKNALVIRQYENRKGLVQYVLAVNVAGQCIGNSSNLNFQDVDGNRFKASVLPEQLELQNKLSMIPFSVIKDAGLSLETFREIDKGNDETIYEKITARRMTSRELELLKQDPMIKNVMAETAETELSTNEVTKYFVTYLQGRHFTGARLFSLASNDISQGNSRAYYLMDVDRNELQHGIVNPFLVSLVEHCETISDAYESLKPNEVKQAESDGLKVERQGEWFFIPLKDELYGQRLNQRLESLASADQPTRGILRAGNNRPNDAEIFVSDETETNFYVKGKISHRGREHQDLLLDAWFRAIPNTSTQSWQISGDID